MGNISMMGIKLSIVSTSHSEYRIIKLDRV